MSYGDQAREIRRLHAEGWTVPQLVNLLGCSRQNVHQCLNVGNIRRGRPPKGAPCSHCGCSWSYQRHTPRKNISNSKRYCSTCGATPSGQNRPQSVKRRAAATTGNDQATPTTQTTTQR